jgi:hypothetical protein
VIECRLIACAWWGLGSMKTEKHESWPVALPGWDDAAWHAVSEGALRDDERAA